MFTDKVVLITGSRGFIGSHLVNRLRSQGIPFRTLDCDITSPRARREVERLQPDVIIHLAAQVSVSESVRDPVLDCITNAVGTVNILCGRMVYTSSCSVYGEADIPTCETTPIRPLSPYACAKASAEHYVLMRGGCVLRLSNVYGPGCRGIIGNLDKGVIYGSGEQIRDFVHVDDVVEALIRAATMEVSGVFNIGTGVDTRIRDLFRGPVRFEPARAGDVQRSVLDCREAREVLGWRARISLEEGLGRCLRTA
jgi:UDP-glucose 4-epimerase